MHSLREAVGGANRNNALLLPVKDPILPLFRPTKPTTGRLYKIEGVILPNATKFTVNFLIGGKNGDIALHLDNRFDKQAVVRNSHSTRTWNNEERWGGPFPLKSGEAFSLQILVEESRFMIAYNDVHFTEFVHRFPLETIDNIEVTGDVQLLLFHEEQAISSMAPKPQQLMQLLHHSSQPPHFELSEGLSNGRKVQISGYAGGKSNVGFDFKIASSSSDIAFHMSCRFSWFPGVVLNNFCDGRWGTEVRPSNLKLQKNKQFIFEISATAANYVIVLDGCCQTLFPIRQVLPTHLRSLEIHGGFKLSFVLYAPRSKELKSSVSI